MVYSTPDKNPFFSIPVGIIRRRAQLPPPLPGQPGPFSLGADGVLAKVLEQAGFRDVQVRKVDSPVRLPSAAECVRFERESFGALHQMMAKMSERERGETWTEIEAALGKFETDGGFVGPVRNAGRRRDEVTRGASPRAGGHASGSAYVSNPGQERCDARHGAGQGCMGPRPVGLASTCARRASRGRDSRRERGHHFFAVVATRVTT